MTDDIYRWPVLPFKRFAAKSLILHLNETFLIYARFFQQFIKIWLLYIIQKLLKACHQALPQCISFVSFDYCVHRYKGKLTFNKKLRWIKRVADPILLTCRRRTNEKYLHTPPQIWKVFHYINFFHFLQFFSINFRDKHAICGDINFKSPLPTVFLIENSFQRSLHFEGFVTDGFQHIFFFFKNQSRWWVLWKIMAPKPKGIKERPMALTTLLLLLASMETGWLTWPFFFCSRNLLRAVCTTVVIFGLRIIRV